VNIDQHKPSYINRKVCNYPIMSIEERSIDVLTTEPVHSGDPKGILSGGQVSHPRPHHSRSYSHIALWVCLLLALIIRAWLVARTNGVIDGDEVLVGVQAEHILRGELPIYFYGQPYMGSLEAYLVALFIAIAGPSVWTLRAEPVLLSLVVVWLIWKLAATLAEIAQLPSYAKLFFMTIAALIAAIPPLYDGILELRTYGGYIETFILMLLLLLSALQLTQRWHGGAAKRELALRWAGIGFIAGLGFWIYPLIISAVLAAAAWIACDRIAEAFKLRQEIAAEPRRYVNSTLKGSIPAIAAIPASVVGFAPALYWGAIHQWQNIAYILGVGISTQRYASISHVTRSYITCVVPRVISGAVPKEAPLLVTLHSPLLVVGLGCTFATAALVTASFLWQDPLLLRIRRLAALPLLFGACTALIFCTSKATVYVVISCNYDIAGRYATPLVLALPFFFATVFTFAAGPRGRSPGGVSGVSPEILSPLASEGSALQKPIFERPARGAPTIYGPGGLLRCMVGAGNPVWRTGNAPALLLLCAVVLAYLGTQAWTYGLTDPGYTFQSAYCLEAPANNEPIIAYMQHERISYAWASNWLAYGIVFKTNGSIIAADPLPFLPRSPNIDRIPANTEAVRHADRPTLLVFVHHNDVHPLLLRYLDDEKVTYRAARFSSEPGIDVLVATPLSRTVSPFEAPVFQNIFTSCND